MTATSSSTKNTRQRLFILFGAGVSALFLFLAFQNLKPEVFLESLREINIPILLFAAAVYFLAVLVIAWRWQFLLKIVRAVPLWPLTQIVMVGYMGNNVYPLRAGEALRVYLLKRNHDVPVTGAAMSAVVERVFDGIVMLTFIVIGILLIDIQSEEIRAVVTFASPIFLTAVATFFILSAFPQALRGLVKWVTRFMPARIAEIVTNLSEEILTVLEGLRSPVQLFGAVFASYLTWAVEASVYWMVMNAFGMDYPYPVALLVVGTVNLAGLIPASPGQLGVYEFFVSSVLIVVGTAPDLALAYAIVVHIVIWLPVTVAGFLTLIRQGLGWQSITHAQELEAEVAQ